MEQDYIQFNLISQFFSANSPFSFSIIKIKQYMASPTDYLKMDTCNRGHKAKTIMGINQYKYLLYLHPLLIEVSILVIL